MEQFTHLKSWGQSLDSGGLDSWGNFIPRMPREYYDQHAIVYAYAPGAGIPREEAEFRSILAHLQKIDPDNVEESTVGHWTYSSFNLILVRLLDDNGEPTAAALAADEVLRGLEDYPVFDEEAVTEAEYAAALEYLTDSCYISDDFAGEVLGILSDNGNDFLDNDGSIYVSGDDLGAAVDEVFRKYLPDQSDPDFRAKAENLAEALGLDPDDTMEAYLDDEEGLINPRWSDARVWAAKLAAFLAGERIGTRQYDAAWPA